MEIRFGSMEIGNRRILKSDSATKALSAVRLSSLVATNTPKVAKDTFQKRKFKTFTKNKIITTNGAHCQLNDPPILKYAVCFKIDNSFFRISSTSF